MKKLLSLMLTLSLAVFVIGCKSEDKPNTPKKDDSGNVSLKDKGSMPEAGSDKKGSEQKDKDSKKKDAGSDKKK